MRKAEIARAAQPVMARGVAWAAAAWAWLLALSLALWCEELAVLLSLQEASVILSDVLAEDIDFESLHVRHSASDSVSYLDHSLSSILVELVSAIACFSLHVVHSYRPVVRVETDAEVNILCLLSDLLVQEIENRVYFILSHIAYLIRNLLTFSLTIPFFFLSSR